MSSICLLMQGSTPFFQYFIVGLIAIIVPYLIGAIPTGYLFAKLFFGIDITQQGSGNIGATNSARVLGGVKYFFLIFFIDAGKAAGYLYLLKTNNLLFGYYLICAAIMLLIGNSYSCFLKWKGGKGVATLIGVIAALARFKFTVSLLLVWGLLFAYFRKVDAASLLALLISLFIYGAFFYAQYPEFIYFLLFAFVWLCIRHQSNIKTWITTFSQKSK